MIFVLIQKQIICCFKNVIEKQLTFELGILVFVISDVIWSTGEHTRLLESRLCFITFLTLIH